MWTARPPDLTTMHFLLEFYEAEGISYWETRHKATVVEHINEALLQ
jgi:hypothetical protein